MISRLHDLQFEPALRALFAHVAPANRVLSVVAERWNDAAAKLDVIEALLARDGGFAVGARPTMADCGFAVSFVVRDSLAACLAQRVTESPRICAWRMALDTHPQIAPVTDAYRRTLEAWIATRR
jgi:glutathione S-transferase